MYINMVFSCGVTNIIIIYIYEWLSYLLLSYTDDYRSGPHFVTFSSGRTSSSIYIGITDDNVVESTESFILTIDTNSQTGISLGYRPQATVTISDDDGNYCSH